MKKLVILMLYMTLGINPVLGVTTAIAKKQPAQTGQELAADASPEIISFYESIKRCYDQLAAQGYSAGQMTINPDGLYGVRVESYGQVSITYRASILADFSIIAPSEDQPKKVATVYYQASEYAKSLDDKNLSTLFSNHLAAAMAPSTFLRSTIMFVTLISAICVPYLALMVALKNHKRWPQAETYSIEERGEWGHRNNLSSMHINRLIAAKQQEIARQEDELRNLERSSAGILNRIRENEEKS